MAYSQNAGGCDGWRRGTEGRVRAPEPRRAYIHSAQSICKLDFHRRGADSRVCGLASGPPSRVQIEALRSNIYRPRAQFHRSVPVVSYLSPVVERRLGYEQHGRHWKNRRCSAVSLHLLSAAGEAVEWSTEGHEYASSQMDSCSRTAPSRPNNVVDGPFTECPSSHTYLDACRKVPVSIT